MRTLQQTTEKIISIISDKKGNAEALEYLIAKEISEYGSDMAKWGASETAKEFNYKMKEHTKVKTICINIKEGVKEEPTMLASAPDGGIVKEYYDRYEWDVIHEQGLSLMKVNKKDFVSVEILL